MNQTPIQNGTPFSEERTREIIREFKREGFVLIPGVLEADETKALRDKTDELFDDPQTVENDYLRENILSSGSPMNWIGSSVTCWCASQFSV